MPKKSVAQINEPYGKRAVLEEQRRTFDKVSEASNSLDQKLQSLLGSASLIVSLVGILQLAALQQKGGAWFWIVLIITVLLYIFMVGFILWGLRPLQYLDPISSNWEELAQRYFDESEDHVLEYLISDYLTFIERNRNLNANKVKAVRITIGLFISIVVILLISMPFGLGTQLTPSSQPSPLPQITPSPQLTPSSQPSPTP